MSVFEITTYILLALVVFFAFVGFLIGVGRGIRKAGLRLIIFIVFFLASIFLTPLISKTVLNYNFNIAGLNGTLSQIINDFIMQQETLVAILADSPTLQAFAEKLPVILANLVVFIVAFLAFSWVGWVFHMILSSILFKKKKKDAYNRKEAYNKREAYTKGTEYNVDLKPKKKRKHRLLGGLVGAANGVLFLVFLLIPITGFASLVAELTFEEQTVYAVTTTEPTPISTLIQENLDENIVDGIKAYNQSAFKFISAITGADSMFFDTLTKETIATPTGNVDFVLRGEIKTVAAVVNNAYFLIEIDENVVFKNLDYEKIENAVNEVLSLKLYDIIMPDLLNWVYDDISKPAGESILNLDLDPTMKEIIDMVVYDYKKEGGIATALKNDIKSVLEIGISLGKSGIVDEFLKPQINITNVVEILNKNNKDLITKTFGKIFTPVAYRAVAVKLLNEQIKALTNNNPSIQEIAYEKVVWTELNTEIVTIASSLLDIYTSIENDFNTDMLSLIDSNPYELLNANSTLITGKLGTIMSTVQNTTLLVNQNGDKVIYNQFMDYLATFEVANYVDVASFKTTNAWSNEMTNLNTLWLAVKDSGVLANIVENIDSLENINFTEVIEKLSALSSDNQTHTHHIISSVLNSGAFRKLINLGFNYLNDLVEANQFALSQTVALAPLNVNAPITAQEKVYLVSFFDNLVLYLKDVDIDNLTSDTIDTVLNSDLSRLGLALDSVKQSALFGSFNQGGVNYVGFYKSLIAALDSNTQISSFASFDKALDLEFSFNDEFDKISSALDKMLEIEINGKSLLHSIMDGVEFETLMEDLTGNDIEAIILPIIQSKLLSKNVVGFVNVIIDSVNDLSGANNPTLDEDASLIDQAEDIAAIIKNGVSLVNVLSGAIDEEALQENAAELGNFLNQLKLNALNQGVFEGTYNSLIDYLKTDATFGNKLSTIFDSYIDQTDIDWVKLIDLVASVGQGFNPEQPVDTELTTKLGNVFADMFQNEEYKQVTKDIVDTLNSLMTITSEDDEDSVLNKTTTALGFLATAQNNYGGTKLEYANKVNDILNLLSSLTGIEQIDYLTTITDYQAEIDAINAVQAAVEAFDQISNPSIDDITDLIDALSESNLMLTLFLDNNVEIDTASIIEDELRDYITDMEVSQEVKDNLLQLFNLN